MRSVKFTIKDMTKIIMTALTAALVCSCTPAQRSAFPVAIGFKRDGVEATYSPNGGVVISIDQNLIDEASAK